jgi:hypothetical protein
MIDLAVPTWTHWERKEPPAGVLIQVSRDEWERPWLGIREDVPGEINAVGLFWKLTGIGREQLAQREAAHAVSV